MPESIAAASASPIQTGRSATPTAGPIANRVQAGGTAYVSVAVATGWRSPDAPRAVDAPALEAPVRPRDWLAAMTDDECAGLVGIADSQVLLGESVRVLQVLDEWARVVVPHQPTPLDGSGYPLWIPVAQLTVRPTVASGEQAVVTVPTTWLRDADDGNMVEISFGTRLPVRSRGPDGIQLGLPDGGEAWAVPDAVAVVAYGADALHPTAAAVVATARSLIGVPYQWAGTSGFGFDCSGLVYAVYRAHGVLLPRDARPQSATGNAVERERLRAGDLVFFARDGVVHHVAIYVGDGQALDAPDVGLAVRVMALDELPYGGEYCGARRVLPG